MRLEDVVDYLATAAGVPDDDKFLEWTTCQDAFDFVAASTDGDIPLVVLGRPAFLASVLIPAHRLTGDYMQDLLGWNFTPMVGETGYAHISGKPVLYSGFHHVGSAVLEGAEALVFHRHFDGYPRGRERYFEIDQRFVQASAIHRVEDRKAYCRLDELGNLEDIVRIYQRGSWSVVTIRRSALDLYLYATGSVLVRLFEFDRYREIGGIVGRPSTELVLATEDAIAQLARFGTEPNIRGAYLRGAHVIRASEGTAERFEQQAQGRKLSREYATFVIQDLKHGDVREWFSDPAQLGNYFVQSDLPLEVSPAFFRAEVLVKYKQDSERFTVDQWQVLCRGQWSLPYKLNDAGQVFAYIKNLSSIPYQEQLHWKSYNEAPTAPIPENVVKTDFLGEFLDEVDDPLEDLKNVLRGFPAATHSGQNMALWEPGEVGLERAFDEVHYVHTESRDEYLNEVGALSRCVVEGLQTKPLRALADHLGCYNPQHASIALLAACLRARGTNEGVVHEVIEPLQQLQTERLPGAHRSNRVVRGSARYRALVQSVRDSLKLLSDLTKAGVLDI